MIRKSVDATKRATFAILLPDTRKAGMPTPMGTGFFVSPEGHFVTAAHVITVDGTSAGQIRIDLASMTLTKEQSGFSQPAPFCRAPTLQGVEPSVDFALFKADPQTCNQGDWLIAGSAFPHIEVSTRLLDDGEPVYSFGYPLSSSGIVHQTQQLMIGTMCLAPRVTSAIVSSSLDQTRMIMTTNDPRVYVLDKALNYGNSGGPIVAETGKVHAFCSRFQPVLVPQPHLKDASGKVPAIVMPSLYGIVTSLANTRILALLSKHGIPVVAT